VLTRDIISPIKRAVEGLDEFIKDYEQAVMEEKIYQRMALPPGCVRDLRLFTRNEFKDNVGAEGKIAAPPPGTEAGSSENLPVVGSVVEACDKFAAFVEASLSIRYGVSTAQLQTAKQRLAEKWSRCVIHGYELRPLYDYFS
jgi:putative hydrolase of HD superfamily